MLRIGSIMRKNPYKAKREFLKLKMTEAGNTPVCICIAELQASMSQ